jgi:hypothetical protein
MSQTKRFVTQITVKGWGGSPLSPESSLLTTLWVTPISYARDTHPENFPETKTLLKGIPLKNRRKNLTDLKTYGIMTI